MLEIDDLHVAYGQVEAVRGVTLYAGAEPDRLGHRPERRRQDDPARRLMGLLPSRGRSPLRRRRPRTASTSRRASSGGSRLVPEKRELFGDLSVLDNLRPRRLCAAPARQRTAAPARCGLRALSAPRRTTRATRQYALGRRTADARARPRADVRAAPADARRAEPRAGAADRARHPSIVRTLRDDGVSILLVEQNARAALETSDHGYVLETGEIAFAGASDPARRRSARAGDLPRRRDRR